MEKVIGEIDATKTKTVYFQIDAMTTNLPMKLSHLPNSLPLDGAVRIELVEGVPIFRASSLVQGVKIAKTHFTATRTLKTLL